MIKIGNLSVTSDQILNKISDIEIAAYYFGIIEIPTLINSPLREDKKPSFGFYLAKGKLRWKDLSSNTGGDIFDLLQLYWNMSYTDVLSRVYKDVTHRISYKIKNSNNNTITTPKINNKPTEIGCKIRKWQSHDLEYWQSYGITKQWLVHSDIYPISRLFINKNNHNLIFKVDSYAYAFVERKEHKVTMKIYQPFSTKYKWINGNDKSVIALWTKVPQKANNIVICSSVKDALCLSANALIPAIAVQGEGYNLSDNAIKSLKERYNNIYIFFDNDKPGIKDSTKLAELTGFTNIILPYYGAKDISDLYKLYGKEEFLNIILPLFNNK